jgi:osmotically-inducible protein OsmY
MPTNEELVADVTDELFWDTKVEEGAVAVSADDGKVTLRGTIGNLQEKRQAVKVAERVFGVVSVDNELRVKLTSDEKRADPDLRGDLLQALMLDNIVPSSVDVQVSDGVVTLTGTADWQYQRDEAQFIASTIAGTLDVFDEIELTYPNPQSGDVKDSIRSAFKRNDAVDASDLRVSTANGSVTLEGTVGSWAEHDEAILAAWAAPGVSTVHDALTVVY